ncbi:MAG: hypothetical protein B7Z81_10840 [Acidocella sp. 20-61-6]|nr:MAG: hypothetical protein B7Z81_10840 [Acidocella sp. 20-61-6]
MAQGVQHGGLGFCMMHSGQMARRHHVTYPGAFYASQLPMFCLVGLSLRQVRLEYRFDRLGQIGATCA